MDDTERKQEKQAIRRNQAYQSRIPAELRWSEWVQKPAGEALKHLKEKVFPWLWEVGEKESSFRQYMEGAEFKLSKPATLIEVCNLIDQMKISEQNQDVQGDLYEYLLGKLQSAGRNGQFRTPRHIIRMMVEVVAPQLNERIGDLAAGTCGFLVNAYQYILEQHTSLDILYDEEGQEHLVGDRLTPDQGKFLQGQAFTATVTAVPLGAGGDHGPPCAASRLSQRVSVAWALPNERPVARTPRPSVRTLIAAATTVADFLSLDMGVFVRSWKRFTTRLAQVALLEALIVQLHCAIFDGL